MLCTVSETVERVDCRPFLRWAGGKSWLVKHFHNYIPKNGFNNYHEPFLGGGSIFMFLQPQQVAYLSDLNGDLVSAYQQVKSNVDGVISALQSYKNTKEFYYKVRDSSVPDSVEEQAARFIFLNQTSFNGIYRVNLSGKYNVPFGYRTKDFFEPENLREVSKLLQNAVIFPSDFRNIISNVSEGDLVFLDPPYTVTHNHNGFVKYNSKLFNEEDQIDLSILIDEIKDCGAYYILTNAAHKWVRQTFAKEGDRIDELGRASLIGGKKAKRGIFSEYVFTNVID
ncbi:MAG: Dam family site-specific DNA-(adenine-N6)-methyltransferase [Flavobacteriales bacterium]|nr:Dam family site-specific DNA-(adenine-N6)-methyltransferase [Flavobacteriales bacterium]